MKNEWIELPKNAYNLRRKKIGIDKITDYIESLNNLTK